MSVKRKVGRPRKYEGSEAERLRQANAASRAKRQQNGKRAITVGLDQECMDLINEVQTVLRAKLPDTLQDKITITYKDTVKIALTEYVRGTRNG